jgi:3-methyladenine DNA glycosylase Tag
LQKALALGESDHQSRDHRARTCSGLVAVAILDPRGAASRDLKRRGFSFVGSTVIYGHMQAVGMVNDHLIGCFRYRDVRQLGIGSE